jgi:hypothetical protein
VTKTYFFWGVYDGNEGDETWRVLHEHFEKLAKENKIEFEVTDRSPTKTRRNKERR